MPTTSPTERILTSETAANQARVALTDLNGAEGTLCVERRGQHTQPLPPETGRILQQVLEAIAQGHTVTVGAMPEEISTSTAADVLGVSRPTLMKMIRAGEIAAHKVGTHHRLASDDVYAARKARRSRERAAFERLRELDDSFECEHHPFTDPA